jgi:DNA ligase (NAD+)
VQVGRTGVLTPVADLEPVSLAGSTVSRASLHNAEEIQRKDVRIGDRVTIEKAGEIIPQVLEVLKEERSGKERVFRMPSVCPECEGPVGKVEETDVALRCLNGLSCPAQLKETIRYFATRRAMNIEKVGPALVDQLVDQGLVKDVADLFSLKASQLGELERMAEKSAQNVIESIETAKKEATLPRVLTALGIPHVGEVAAQQLAEFGGSLDHFLDTPAETLKEELDALRGLGPKMSGAIVQFFRNPKNRKVIQKLERVGVHPKMERRRSSGKLAGLSFCITGTLTRPRDEIKEDILRAGGRWTPSVTKKTNYLVAGESVGSEKLKAAEKYGVKVIDEKALGRLLG